MRITTIIGTRPELVKMAKLIPLLDKNFEHKFIFLAQHYSPRMVDVFFKELNIRTPDARVYTRGSSREELMEALDPIMKTDKSDYVLVYGDTNSTYAASIIAKGYGKKLIHVEAGLRCFDNNMPEEFNRVAIDALSDVLFAPTELERYFLTKEKIQGEIFVVGNTIADVCNVTAKESNDYILVTMHRQENVDNANKLIEYFNIFSKLPYNIIFPMHPRTMKQLWKSNVVLPKNLKSIEPIGYNEFLELLSHCNLVMTDSGGVQEEAFIIGKPCIVLRNNTERWHPIRYGCGFLAGCNTELITYLCKMLYETSAIAMPNVYGNGHTSEKIIEHLRGLK